MKRRFLYISFFFPPAGGPEARHNLSQVRALYKRGFTPTVITAPEDIDYPKDEHLLQLVPEDIGIKRFPWPGRNNRIVDRVRRLGRFPENPVVFKNWQDIYRAAKAELSHNDYDFIYSVHGIGSAHLAARQLKKETGLKWVAEFRDPWVHNCILWDYMKDHSWAWWYRKEFNKARRRQRQVLSCADLVVVESPVHAELSTADFGIENKRVVPYGMGFNEEYFAGPADPIVSFPTAPVIGFVGSAYYGYDDALRNFVSALKQLEDAGCRFTFVSVGDSSSRFATFARQIGLHSFVPVERVSLAQALALMRTMDLGLVCVGQEYRANINSKLWEYMRANLSILALVPEDGAMARVVTEGRCGYVLPYDAAGMKDILRQLLDDYRRDRLLRATPEYVAQFSREKIGVKLVQKIEEMLCSG